MRVHFPSGARRVCHTTRLRPRHCQRSMLLDGCSLSSSPSPAARTLACHMHPRPPRPLFSPVACTLVHRTAPSPAAPFLLARHTYFMHDVPSTRVHRTVIAPRSSTGAACPLQACVYVARLLSPAAPSLVTRCTHYVYVEPPARVHRAVLAPRSSSTALCPHSRPLSLRVTASVHTRRGLCLGAPHVPC